MSHKSPGLDPENLLSDNSDDVFLIEQVVLGNEEAFSILYRRHTPALILYCARMLNGDEALAADIVDEAMFEVWRSAAKFGSKSRVSTWIHAIARNKLIDYLRKNSDSKLDKDLMMSSMEQSQPTPEDRYSEQSRGSSVKRYMEKLSEEHRDVLSLAYYKELTVAEIARMLNISENTVKTRMYYARLRMKKILFRAGIVE